MSEQLELKEKCAHCGAAIEGSRYATSRKDNVTKLCPACGTREALVDYVNDNLRTMKLHTLASIITADWKKPYFGAKPYLQAMACINEDGMYICDTWKSVVLYFLSNATTWKGEVARAVKAELKDRLKTGRWDGE